MKSRLINKYELLGNLLFSSGVVLGCLLGIRLLRDWIDNQVKQSSSYLLINSTLAVNFPPATPIPTFTPTPSPTAKPPPLPAIRLSIPSIGVNTTIVEVFPIKTVSSAGEEIDMWDTVAFAVGHYSTSGNPGGGRNIVLSGHNNTLGEVFRDLAKLSPGDEIILFTEENTFNYTVQKKFIIPFRGVEEEGNELLRSYAAPQSTEMITLISCWPYATNANRIIIIAMPSVDEN